MRRKDKEIHERGEIDSILRRAQVCRIAMLDGNLPYLVPVNYGYDGENLYFHSAPEGKKLDLLNRSPRLCFEVETDVAVLPDKNPCEWATRYRCVIGTGKAEIIRNKDAKRKAFEVILAQHGSHSIKIPIPDNALKKVAVVRIKIERLTAKQSGF